MMEGISSEAASLAGHLQLSNLCWIYDSNRVTIEGHTDITFTEDVAARFIAYGWNVTTVADVNDLGQVARGLHSFLTEHERPTLMLVHSHIGYGSPVEDSPKAHGEPLGVEAVRATKRFLGMPRDADFYVPDGIYDWFAEGIGRRGQQARAAWEEMFETYRAAYPDLADEIERMQHRTLPDGWAADLPEFKPDPKGIATRDSSAQVLNAVAGARALAARRLGRPHPVDQDPADVRRGGRLPARRPRRPQPALRHPRARLGRDRQRAGPDQGAAVLVHVPDLLRLRPRRDPAVGADGDPGPAHLHPRLDRRGRGRAHPPAGRAARLAAGHARAAGVPAGRRQRGRRDLAGGDRAAPRARRAGPVPPGPAHPGPLNASARRPASPAAATSWPRPAAAGPT